MINRQAVTHRPCSEFAYAEDEQTLVIRLRAARDNLLSCVLYYGDRADPSNAPVFTAVPMRAAASDLLWDWFEVKLSPVYPRVQYYFELQTAQERAFFYADHFAEALPGLRLGDRWLDHRCEYYQFPYIRREDLYTVPAWFQNAVVYNVFPDSFASAEGRLEAQAKRVEREGIVSVSRLGGTLNGIRMNLAYVQALGFNTLYLNPFFHAEAYHKYDTVDYLHVDPCMGTDKDFAALVNEVHRRGMHILIDGVFNHCGQNFFAFRDLLEKQEASPYRDWFYTAPLPAALPNEGEPPSYACFAYVPSMPKLNTGNEEASAYFCEVGKHWVREYGVDGWRLDVANEVDHRFWRDFHSAVLSVNPQAVLIAEAWEEARSFVCADQFHAAMCYDFRRFARDFFALGAMDAAQMNDRLVWLRMRYSEPAARAQLNLLDSHDVPRFLSLCGGNTAKLRQAIALLMLFPGVPCLFYGDERELQGIEENEYRQPMPWDAAPCETERFVKEAAALRMLPATKQASFHTLSAERGSGLLGFALQGTAQTVQAWFNAGSKSEAVPALSGKVVLAQGYLAKEGLLEAVGLVVAVG
ncbi:MAG: glycoside hydrolase family 13 protein [Clostridia bacterium]